MQRARLKIKHERQECDLGGKFALWKIKFQQRESLLGISSTIKNSNNTKVFCLSVLGRLFQHRKTLQLQIPSHAMLSETGKQEVFFLYSYNVEFTKMCFSAQATQKLKDESLTCRSICTQSCEANHKQAYNLSTKKILPYAHERIRSLFPPSVSREL